MHTFLLVVISSGLVLLQTTRGLTANLEQDADFVDEVAADGFILYTTKGPTETEKPRDNYNAIVTHDSLDPEANLSLFQKDSVPIVTALKSPEASTELTTENTHELPKNERAAISITVGSSHTNMLSAEENVEGSGIVPEWVIKTHTSMIHTTVETVAEVDSDGSGMISETFNEKQDEDLPFITTTVSNSGDLNTSTPVYRSPGGKIKSRMGSGNSVEEDVIVKQENNEVKEENPMDKISQDPTEDAPVLPKIDPLEHVYGPEPTKSAQVKDGTPGWLLILALCLTLAAVICVFVGIGTKDMWYGPSRQCLSRNSTESKRHEEYDKAATLPLSDKEKKALMSTQKEARKATDCTISIEEEVPEKEYLM